MSKFNTSNVKSRIGDGFIQASGNTGLTHNAAEAFEKMAKSELFLAVVSDFAGESTFYESAKVRSERISELVKEVVVSDPEWFTSLVGWLRNEANMRSISLVIALEGAKAMIDAGIPGGRTLVSSAIARADEPGEAMAWWFSKVGRKMPAAIKRGIADGAVNTYSEYSLGKYDTASHSVRFADVINMTHPSPKNDNQSSVFSYSLARRRDNNAEIPANLKMIQNRKAILSMSLEDKKKLIISSDASAQLKAAGLTWENIAGDFGLDKTSWEAVIPTMGYMALIRNLRNFEKENVSSSVLDTVAAKIANKEEVSKSKQLPFRFLAAYQAVRGVSFDRYGYQTQGVPGSGRFDYPLTQALEHSLVNVPSLKGNTLILVDRSGSMFGLLSKNTSMNYADSAALFGSALAVRAEKATLVEFGTSSNEVKFSKNSSVLALTNSFSGLGGTATEAAIKKHFTKEFDRVIIITDEQYSWREPTDVVPENVPVYTFNLAGYKYGHKVGSVNRITIGGLQDQSFALIPLLEAGASATWPWEK